MVAFQALQPTCTCIYSVEATCNHHLQIFSVQRNVGLDQQVHRDKDPVIVVQVARVLEGQSEHCITHMEKWPIHRRSSCIFISN